MDINKRIKHILIDKEESITSIAKTLDFVGSPQALSNKLYKGNFKFGEVEAIAERLGCEVIIKDKKTGKTY